MGAAVSLHYISLQLSLFMSPTPRLKTFIMFYQQISFTFNEAKGMNRTN